MRGQVEVTGSAVLALAGGAAWLVGSSALPAGHGTVVLAVGLAVTAWLTVRAARTGPAGPRIDRDRRRRVLRLVVVGVGLVVGGTFALRATGNGELTVPLAAAVCGVLMLPLAGLLDRRGLLAVGAGLLALAAGGGFLALNSAGGAEPQGLIGFGGALLLWAAAARQAGLTDELRGRIRR